MAGQVGYVDNLTRELTRDKEIWYEKSVNFKSTLERGTIMIKAGE